ncbi:hypothetical protein ANO14919_076270 [Xylariales sp. No.14919]|nr:hypothetical protein ANO14919_076270 [Xylariales sp. No.14919]
MRFGRDYHRHFVPEWSGFYVQYDLIKTHLNLRDTVDNSVQLLSNDIEAFISFHRGQLCAIDRRERALWSIFYEPQSLCTFHPCELNFLLCGLNDLLEELLKLQWFDRINQEAINRLLKKPRLIEPQGESSRLLLGSLRSQWHQRQQAQQLGLSRTRRRLQSSISRINEAIDTNEGTYSSFFTSVLGLPLDAPVFRDNLFRTLGENESDDPNHFLMQLAASPEVFSPTAVHSLFVFFVVRRSWRNVLMLLEHIAPPDNLNFGHDDLRLLVTVCVQETHSLGVSPTAITRSNQDMSGRSSALDVFAHILQLLEPANAKELFTSSPDDVPLLHLLAKNGLLEWCRLVLGRIRGIGEEFNITTVVLSADSLKLTPLHYALIYHHSRVVDFFSGTLVETRDDYATSDCQALLGSYLSLAVKFGKTDVVARISHITNPDVKSIYGITALHVAARDGIVDIISLLLQAGAGVDVTEHPRGWTPLFEAAVNGWAGAVQYLIEHGANTAVTDYGGWTAEELATYRGHLAIAELVKGAGSIEHTQSIADTSRPAKRAMIYRAGAEPGDTIVNLNLGPMQIERNSPPVQLNHFSQDHIGAKESLFSLNISAAGQTHRVRLPILDDRTNAPLIFVFPQGADLQVSFKIFRDDPEVSQDGVLVCGGTTLLESNKLLFGATRQSLVREHTVSILDSTTLDIAGSILFTYVIGKPFVHLQSPKYSFEELRKSGSSVTLVGHRGLGQNVTGREHLQIGENTVESFIAAADAGASFVEVTRDLTPVIYHDFSLSESGTDIPIHDLTVDQYKYASSVQTSHRILDTDEREYSCIPLFAKVRPRSLSQSCGVDPGVSQIRDRLKHTVDFKEKGMKSNIRGDVIQQPLATLKDLFDKVPKTVGFNIEIKYPRFHETVGAGVAPVALELNLCVDTILEHVNLYGGDRPIVFSSFTPEVCILLSLKQRAYPVMFITNAGKLPMIDVEKRAANMHVAVKFAKLWNLAGIVFASEPLLLCPRLINYVKSFGLVCASYGPRNSLPDDVIVQALAGLDVLILDRVGLVAKILKKLTY